MKHFSLFILLALSVSSYCQITVGQYDISYGKRLSSNYQKNLEKLKNSNTIFYCLNNDDVEKFQEELEPVWNITQSIECTPYPRKNQIQKNNSYFVIIPVELATSQNAILFKLTLLMIDDDGELIQFGNTILIPEPSENGIYESFEYKVLKNHDFDERLEIIYASGEFHQWRLGIVKNYLKHMNNQINENKTHWYKDEITNKKELQKLKSQELVIPNYVFLNVFGRKRDYHKVIKKYPYKIKVVDSEQLGEKILNEDSNFFYINRLGLPGKVICVYNRDGEIVYNYYTTAISDFKFKSSDLKRILSKMK